MASSDLEDELAFAESLAAHHGTWRTAAAELRRAMGPVRQRRARAKTPASLNTSPAALAPIAAELGAEVAKVPDGRHPLYLALSGTLLARGISSDQLEYFIASVATSAGDPKVLQRVSDARSSSRAWDSERPITGYGTLRAHWPRIAAVVDKSLPRPVSSSEKRAAEQLSRPLSSPVDTLPAALKSIDEILAQACADPANLHVLVLPPGVGKTRGAVEFAMASNIKVAIVHPSNEVARTHFELAERIAPGRSSRRFGALSVVNADGSPVCRKGADPGSPSRSLA